MCRHLLSLPASLKKKKKKKKKTWTKLLSGEKASMFCGGLEAEAVISSLLLQTETEKSKQILTNSVAVCPYKSKSRGHAK